MSDLEKLFEHAPEGATAIKRTEQGKMFFENSRGEYYHGTWKKPFCDKWTIIATRPTEQTKTVADAYEWANGKWEDYSYDAIAYNPSNGNLGYYVYNKGINDKWFHCCFLDEFKAYAKEQEGKPHFKATRENLEKLAKDAKGEKWTPTDKHGYECKIIHGNGELVWVEYKAHSFCDDLLLLEELKPIKPKLTKAEAWDKLMERQTNSAEVNTLKQQYDII